MPLFVEIAVPTDIDSIEVAAEALTGISAIELVHARELGRPFPPLYESGIVYRRESPGQIRHPEDWQTAESLYKSKQGDCEDVANVRAAELRVDEGDEGARVEIIQNPSGSYHAIVRRGDGTLEDPSRILLALEAERRKRRPMAKLTVRTRNLGSYCLGEVVLPITGGGSVRASGVGGFPWDALKKATSVAMRIVTDPALAPYLPPGAAIAIKEARAIANMAQNNPAALKAATPRMAPAGKAIAKSFLKHQARTVTQTAQRARPPADDQDDDYDQDDERDDYRDEERGMSLAERKQRRYQEAIDRFNNPAPVDEAQAQADAEQAFADAEAQAAVNGDDELDDVGDYGDDE